MLLFFNKKTIYNLRYECVIDNFYSYQTKYVVDTQKNHLIELPKHMLKLRGKKIFTILYSNFLSKLMESLMNKQFQLDLAWNLS